jgi:hypothetical protein
MVDKNNVVEFPGSDPKIQEELDKEFAPEEVQEAVNKGQQIALQQMEKDRKDGLEKADKAVWNLDNDETIVRIEDKDIERRLRNLEMGLRGLTTSVDGANKLLDVIKHDLIKSLTQLEEIMASTFSAGAHLQVLIHVLREKGQVTEEELKEAWGKLVPQAVQAMKNSKPE